MKKMVSGSDGSLWSASLESWLVPDGTTLRLYDRNGQMKLTHAEAEAQLRQIEAQMRLAEAQQKRIAVKRADAEAQRADNEARRAQAEAQRADAADRRAEALAEKMRSLGIDPDQLIKG